MAYTLYPSGRTGPSENIGGSSEYHIDSKFSTSLGSDEARRRFEAIVRKYKELGRDVEFSNSAVSDEIYDLDADEAVRRDLWNRATAAHDHSQHDGWYSLDYYAPLSGKGRWDKSAEGAPIFAVGGEGSRVETGTGGNYGFHSLVYNKDGDLISKVGHGDDRFPVSPDPSTPSPTADAEVPPPALDYSNMSAADLNAEYDKLRMAGDVFKAEQEGMKMHKAFFNK